MTLARPLPGRRVLKTWFRVLDAAGYPRSYEAPHVDTVVPVNQTVHGSMSFGALYRVFEALVWV
jgi:hypothetical protein